MHQQGLNYMIIQDVAHMLVKCLRIGYTPRFGLYASYTTLGLRPLGSVNHLEVYTSLCNLYMIVFR